MTAYLDTNVLIRHFTGEPAAQARRARNLLESGEELVVTDVVVAECAYVLSSVYGLLRDQISVLMKTALGFPSITSPNADLLLRALDLYGSGHDFADAYLVACAEKDGAAVASCDRGIDRIGTVRRIGG